ncbi:glutathione S-transferase [Inquilinus ginsengisoli]|uniref:glutathione S-transferase family protein n=1 Tax=Inquilinus ginsengisoli TaxID=363840 RepID=UPI003D1CFDB0
MITLYSFGPGFGLPDPSPFVTKVEVLLKMAGLSYQADTTGFGRAPKGKLPFIDDDGEVVSDSTFIRWHIEEKYGIDFDKDLDASQRATAWAFEKMVEDQLYWVVIYDRWMDDANFRKGPAGFFGKASAAGLRRQLRATLHGQGLGRHSAAEILALATRSIDAIANFLGDKPFFKGSEPSGVDATMFAFSCALFCPLFETRMRAITERHENLRRYVGRVTAQFYPDVREIAGCRATA